MAEFETQRKSPIIRGIYLSEHLVSMQVRGKYMAYCSKCGFQNPDESTFCSKCGASLKAPMPGRAREYDKQCEDECAGGPRGSSIFWGLFIVIIGFGVLLWALNESNVDLPEWLKSTDIGLLVGILIAAALIVTGLSVIFRRKKV